MFEFLAFAETFYFWLAFLMLAAFALTFLEIFLGNLSIRRLQDILPMNEAGSPRVSIVIAARNEERSMEQALRSILTQDYANLEVVAVDDRSTGSTGAILDRMAQANPRLKVVHITDLPAGWLGKNYAMHVAASQASGEFDLFTDADVVMEKTTISRAVRFMVESGGDHLCATPTVTVRGFMMNAFIATFVYFFGLYQKFPNPVGG